MLAEVRKCAESHDIKGLRYIFVDCLDVDPTFEKYKEDYEYCRTIPRMMDPHRELTGLITDKSRWTTQYWEQLKRDLMKNFSEKRFEHMICVAKVIYADKIVRLRNERGSSRETEVMGQTLNTTISTGNETTKEPIPDLPQRRPIPGANEQKTSPKDEQEREIEADKRKIEEHNRRVEAELKAQRARIKAGKQGRGGNPNHQIEVDGSKKSTGIVAAIITIVVIVAVVFIIMMHK